MKAMASTKTWLLLLALACCGFAPRVFAADSCSIAAGLVDFGTYDPTSATALDGQGSVTVTCTGGNNLPVTIGLGTGGAGTYTPRRMVSGAETLNYNLYTSIGRTTIFGNGGSFPTVTCTVGATSTDCLGSNPAGGTRVAVRTIYGRIPALQNVTGVGGGFTDNVTVTVTF